MKNKQEILNLLKKALAQYGQQCKEEKPGRTGIKRLNTFKSLMTRYEEGNVDFHEICVWFKSSDSNSRLLKSIREVLYAIFDIQTPEKQQEMRGYYGAMFQMVADEEKRLEELGTALNKYTQSIELSNKQESSAKIPDNNLNKKPGCFIM
jgi:hypothetical protein